MDSVVVEKRWSARKHFFFLGRKIISSAQQPVRGVGVQGRVRVDAAASKG